MEPLQGALLADLYQLTMIQAYLESGQTDTAVFEFFVRKLPPQRGFLMLSPLRAPGPQNLTLLIDTYDTEAAARKVVALSRRLKELAVRIDSGDLAAPAKSVRSILDMGGLNDTGIFVSGGIDEDTLVAFAREQAPIDGVGIGTSLVTSSDAPALDCAYKLQEYAGLPRRKRSTGKATCLVTV